MVWLTPSRECAWSGCHRTVHHPARYCTAHRRQGEARDKPFSGATRHSHPSHYKTPAWQRLRRLVLSRDPVCVACGAAPSSHVDHILARKHGGTDALSNLQGLCAHCHTAKTARGG